MINSTERSDIPDISKCFENFVSQTLGYVTRIYAAELRLQSKNLLLCTANIVEKK